MGDGTSNVKGSILRPSAQQSLSTPAHSLDDVYCENALEDYYVMSGSRVVIHKNIQEHHVCFIGLFFQLDEDIVHLLSRPYSSPPIHSSFSAGGVFC